MAVDFNRYSDEELRHAAKTLKEGIRVKDFPVLEQIEKAARLRGLDPTSKDFGEDVIGHYIKVMTKVNKIV